MRSKLQSKHKIKLIKENYVNNKNKKIQSHSILMSNFKNLHIRYI